MARTVTDPLLDFLATRNPAQVALERMPSFEAVYREAPQNVQSILDELSIGELRRMLATAEAQLLEAQASRKPRTVVVGNRELARMLTKERNINAQLRQQVAAQADMAADLKHQLRALGVEPR